MASTVVMWELTEGVLNWWDCGPMSGGVMWELMDGVVLNWQVGTKWVLMDVVNDRM
jgi:hypothetical protein